MRKINNHSRGFSLMEMMVVLLITAIVAAVSAPMISRKMVRSAGTSSPWMWIGMASSIGYNIDNADNKTAFIGTTSDNSNSKLFVQSDNGFPHIGFGQGNNKLFLNFNNNGISLTDDSAGTVANGVAVGVGARAHQTGGVAIGFSSDSTEQGIAIGQNASTGAGGAHDGIAIGNNAKVNGGVDTIVIGSNTNISAGQAVLVGHGGAVGTGSVALGNGSCAGKNSVAIGSYAAATGTNSCVLGAGVQTNESDVIILGNEYTTVKIPGNVEIGGNINVKGKADIGGDTKVLGAMRIKGDTYLGWANRKANTYWRDSSTGSRRISTFGLNKLEKTEVSLNDGTTKFVLGIGQLKSDIDMEKYDRFKDDTLIDRDKFKDYKFEFNDGKTLDVGKISGDIKINNTGVKKDFNSKIIDKPVLKESDRRLKDVTNMFKGGLAELKKLDLFHYTYKDDENKIPHVGVMAQDLMKVFPDAVWKGEDGFYRIRVEDMFYAVINAIKELDERITGNAKKIADLEKQNVEQQKMIEALMQKVEKLEKKVK